MRRLAVTAVAVVGLALTASTASAQQYRNVIRDSGNGANNTIIARNGPGIQLHAPQVYGGLAPAGFAPGYQAGYAPGYAPGGFAPAPVFGGVSRNLISNSGNGMGNTIVARNGGFGYAGSFPGGGIFPGGVNLNIITNSGNGVGNNIVAGNGRPGGLNLNIITNSGNGVGNTVITRNR